MKLIIKSSCSLKLLILIIQCEFDQRQVNKGSNCHIKIILNHGKDMPPFITYILTILAGKCVKKITDRLDVREMNASINLMLIHYQSVWYKIKQVDNVNAW